LFLFYDYKTHREQSGPESANVGYNNVWVVVLVDLQQRIHVLFVSDFLFQLQPDIVSTVPPPLGVELTKPGSERA
jgi:hypothetical protein